MALLRLEDAREMMSGWAHGGRTSKVWHQVCDVGGRVEGTNIRRARLLCDGSIVNLPSDEPYDYRWTPPSHQRCQKPFCQTDPVEADRPRQVVATDRACRL